MDAARLHLDIRRTRQVRPAARLIVLNEGIQKEVLPSPVELIRLLDAVARAQDRKAFAQLFAYFAPRVKGFLIRTGLAESVAEEVTQEVMIAVWRKASYFDPSRAGASTWVFTIARNQRIDRLRRTRSRTADHLLDLSDEPDTPPSGEDIMIMAEREEEVRKALATLSNEQATIVKLSFFSEAPHSEIARELGIPLGTVKSRVRLALNRLRTLLDRDI
ncbi:sigma-70 family RNA polymerase sigma factor [Tardiphaga sp. P9-11]|jgi:RNA polymerase sigma-70 factor (ECF subfamily)|uniref:sigma-70 family RNA polymerase sigma factor n=1 Tax=Tardiphaga sp. P9-11 TaxID=2024614 RepID=UPI001FED59CA|nr:sigma-70 family RNA polymerase sigma factor [Tardiphaga sp. P9-11]